MKHYGVLVASILTVMMLTIGGPVGIAQTKTPAPKAVAAKHVLLDINSVSKAELMTLPGVSDADAQKIIGGRPYARKTQLISKKIVPQATYDKIKDQIIAKQVKTK